MKKASICGLFIFFIIGVTGFLWSEEAVETITREELRDHVYFLASDFLNGRAPGTSGYEIACRYAASQFRAMGMRPFSKPYHCWNDG